jgi:choline dehydrogenase-like flavoprotein
VLPIGRGVGGTTLVNSGTCYRPPTRVVDEWRVRDGLDLVADGGFDTRLADVEATLQVAPVPLEIMGNNGHALLRGAEALGWAAGPLRRNAPGCGGCCQCAVGCPSNAKLGVHLNALPQACAAGARIVSELRVDRISHDGGRVTGVVARRADGSAVEITADHVVVAAGATETPPLLRRSGLGRHHRLGRNLALHPALSAAGLFDDDVTAWQGVLQSAAVEELHERHRVLIEATSTPPGMGSMALPGHGAELMGWIDRSSHLVTLGGMVADRGNGRVLGRHPGRTALTYRVGDVEARRLLLVLSAMGRVLFASGARAVLTGIPGADVVHDLAELDDAVAGADIRRLHIAAFHPTGTAAAGSDAQRHPVDESGRLRGIDGVSVADASILPSCPEVNPQVSIMALATAVAERITA